MAKFTIDLDNGAFCKINKCFAKVCCKQSAVTQFVKGKGFLEVGTRSLAALTAF